MRRIGGILGLLALAGAGLAQQWSTAYQAGLDAVHAAKWMDARTAFKQAVAFRPDDVTGPTVLPGPITDRRSWRNGAPYSPNFLAAYSGLKAADALSGADRTTLLNDVANEFEALLKKNQLSPETFFLLNNVYVQLGDNDRREKVEQRLSTVSTKLNWKVDSEGITPEDQTAINTAFQRSNVVVTPPVTNPTNTGQGGGTTSTPPTGGGTTSSPLNAGFGTRVPIIPTKYALVIGNSESQIPNTALAFANDSAQVMRETLMTSAGYGESNIELVINATREQMLASAKALAERMPRGATVLIYFAGVGSNLDGHDYLAGVDSQSITESASMVSKLELYNFFVKKEANIFAFFEASRPIAKGRYFGTDIPLTGHIAQMQATMPGTDVASSVRGGKTIGLFSDALASVFTEERSNQFPIMEFGWKVFYKIRGGEGGGGSQTPTLPVRVGLDDKAVL